jgi:hypothetical protein
MKLGRKPARSDEDVGVASRLEAYLGGLSSTLPESPPVLDEVMERAVTFVAAMPPFQRRATIERLAAPHDPDRGRQALDALIERAFVAEDDRGCLRLLRRA